MPKGVEWRPSRTGLAASLRWLRDAPWINETRLSVYPRLFLAVYLTYYAIWLIRLHFTYGGHAPRPAADFVTFWAASRMALSGHPADIYQPATLRAIERTIVEMPPVGVFGWFYPPPFLLVVLPLALLAYSWALALWVGATLAAYLSALRKIASWKSTLWLALAFPPTLFNFLIGQNGFLTAALLGGGLAYLPERPILAGCFFGLLVFKPQIAFLVPLVLIFTRQWRAAISAACSALTIMGLSLVAFGPETWRAFFHSLSLSRTIVLEEGLVPYYAQQSVFAAMRLLGLSLGVSYAIQGVVALAAAALVVWLWLARHDHRLKAAAIVLGGLLVTPYLFDYDLTALGLAIAWLASHGIERGFQPFEKSALVFAWLYPLFERFVANHALIALSPPVILTLLTFTMVCAIRAKPAEA